MKPELFEARNPFGGDFPDSRIGASLKPELFEARNPFGGDFPDSRIGASLKPRKQGAERGGRRTSPIRESGPH